MKQLDLFARKYPVTPGHKRTGTSAAAAQEVTAVAPTLRAKVLDVLRAGPATADQCAEAIGESVLAIRPRLSELVAAGRIRDTGRTAVNASGKRAAIWELTPPQN